MSDPTRSEVLEQLRFLSSHELKGVVQALERTELSASWRWVRMNLRGDCDDYRHDFWKDEEVIEIMKLRRRMRNDFGLFNKKIDEP